MAHTLEPDRAVHDSIVAKFHFLPDAERAFDKWLTGLISSYRFLRAEYERWHRKEYWLKPSKRSRQPDNYIDKIPAGLFKPGHSPVFCSYSTSPLVLPCSDSNAGAAQETLNLTKEVALE
jgi:hypothetical protein